jgi:tripartite-type tricarboxylate transporter receptor subunit TctC
MRMIRRSFLRLAGGAATLAVARSVARAQTYPARPVHIVVGFAAGGAFDIAARLVGQWLSDRLGQTFVIENRPGGSTNIATEAVVRAPPDGYTLLLGGATNAVNATLYQALKFDFMRDTAPVAGIIRFPNVVAVNPSFPAATVAELIVHAKANPGKVNYATPGIGTTQHLAGELFRMMAGVDIVHVPYRGAPAVLTDLLGGQVQIAFAPLPASIELVRAGRLRALAVTTVARSEALPAVPTVGEFMAGYEASGWNGVVAPRNTPGDIIERLNREINACLGDPRIKARFADLGGVALPGSPAEFGQLIADETAKWAKVVRSADIKPE